MNYCFVLRQLGKLMVVLSLCLLAVLLWSLMDAGWNDDVDFEAALPLSWTLICGSVLGLGLWMVGRRRMDEFLGRREALLLVGMSWLLAALLGALPFWFWARWNIGAVEGHVFHSFAACYFESMSGFSTTGASVLTDIEALPRGLLMWRSLTQWLGGLGIVVLFVAVLPNVGIAGKKIFQFETTGVSKGGVRPRIAEAARILWVTYIVMTVALVLLLRFTGPAEMDWFNALAHTFTTISTGGFSTKNTSVAAFDSAVTECIMATFMIVAAINFGIYYRLWRRQVGLVYRDKELRVFLLLIVAATAIAAVSLYGTEVHTTRGDTVEPTAANALRYAFVQVTSIVTTSGFGTADFDEWAFVPQAVLLALMFIGGSAASTAGGIKIIRVIIVVRILFAEVQRVFRPGVVQAIKVGPMVVDQDLRQATLVYVIGIPLLFLLGAVLLMMIEQHQGIDFTTAATASAATLNNIGPGFGAVGPAENYGFFSGSSLMVMSLLMALGRLEVYAIFVLFVPKFWRGE